jgi:capsular exopolysaccharide synthesis family protein
MVLAQSGRHVILVSADLRRPRLHEFFGKPNGKGLADALAGTTGIAEVIIDPGVSGLRLVNSGDPPNDPVALLAGEHAKLVFDTMREVSDFVIVDAPPTLAVADASILASLSDAAIFVMDGHVSGRTALAASREQLENSGAVILGGVYNTVDERSGAGYYRYYRYDRYYGSYYGPDQKGPRSNGNGHQNGDGRSNGSVKGTLKRAFAQAAGRVRPTGQEVPQR